MCDAPLQEDSLPWSPCGSPRTQAARAAAGLDVFGRDFTSEGYGQSGYTIIDPSAEQSFSPCRQGSYEYYGGADDDLVDGVDTFSKAPGFAHASAGYDPTKWAAGDGEEGDSNEDGSNDDGQPAYWTQDNPLHHKVRIE